MEPRVRVVGIDVRWTTREGSTGKKSQDRVEVFENDGAVVVVLADGAGGMAGGELAAAMVVDAFRDAPASSVVGVLLELDRSVLKARGAGETTAIVVAVLGDALWGASVGDSEAWLLSMDPLGDECLNEELTCGQSRRRIGTGAALAQPFASSAGKSRRLLIGSDGLFKYASWAAIHRAVCLEPLDQAADALVECVRLPSGGFRDDVSIFLGEWL